MNFFKNTSSLLTALLWKRHQFYCQWTIGSIEFRIWEKPATWLSASATQQLVRDMRQVAMEAQGNEVIPNCGGLQGDLEDLKQRVINIAYDKRSNQPIGFCSQIYLEVPLQTQKETVLHTGLAYVSPAHRQQSFISTLYSLSNLVVLLKRGFRPIWISNVSQVPAVIGSASTYYTNVYPDPIHQKVQTAQHRTLFEQIVRHHSTTFGTAKSVAYDLDNHIIFDSYTGGSDNLKKTFESCSLHRNQVVNEFCKRHLNYERGDDFLQIGQLSVKCIFLYAKQKLRHLGSQHRQQPKK
jgi:hypothetical protein